MKNFDLIRILPIIILVLAIGLSPRFSVGHLASGKSIDLRVEDFVLLFFGIFWLAKIIKERIFFSAKPVDFGKELKKVPLILPVLAWIGMGVFSLIANSAFSNIDAQKGFFYLLKEIEYFFLFFYVFYYIRNIEESKYALKLWVALGVIHTIWIVFQLITGLQITYFYGPTTLIEPGGTSPGGGFLLIIFIFLFNILIYYYLNLPLSNLKKVLLSIAIVSPVIGVLSSGSRGIFAGLVVAIFASLLLATSRKLFVRFFVVSLLASVLIIAVFSFSESPVLSRLFDLSGLKKSLNSSYEFSRPSIWKQQLTDALKPTTPLESSFHFIFGRGKAVTLMGIGESHNQYIRNFIETGIVGLIAFLFLLYSIIKTSLSIFFKSKDPLLIGAGAGLFCSTLVMMAMSLFAESFIVVKINEPYWFFAALTYAVIYINKSNRINQFA